MHASGHQEHRAKHAHAHGAGACTHGLSVLRDHDGSGSRVAIVGLVTNLLLSIVKGVAGYMLHSAVLVAEATHSLSDTLSDVIAIFCWRKSRRPPSEKYPRGYGKLETLGSLCISIILLCGAGGVAMHSCSRLFERVGTAPPWAVRAASLAGLPALAGAMHAHGHAHHHSSTVDPSAILYAALSIVAKESLYHYTLGVARKLRSGVLEANAHHHRSESLASLVSIVAIAGSYMGIEVLDPLGGLVASLLIAKEGASVLMASIQQLCDRSVDHETHREIAAGLDEVVASLKKHDDLLPCSWSDMHAVASGSMIFATCSLQMAATATLADAVMTQNYVSGQLRGRVPAITHLDMKLAIGSADAL